MNNIKALTLLEAKLEQQSHNGEVSGAHNKSHLLKVAELSQLVGKIYQFSEQELFLAFFASLFHDIVRSPSQDKDLKDEILSAELAVKILTDNFDITGEEKESVFYAIENHGDYPPFLKDPKTRNTDPQTLKEKVRLVLFVADKLEQNGVRVIARRSAFVAGERLKDQKGDLPGYGFKVNLDETLVVAVESAIRLTFINPEYIYPAKLQPLTRPMYKIHRDFVLGIFKALNMQIADIAQILLETKRPDGKNLLDVRNIEVDSIEKLLNLIETEGQISNQVIANTSYDIAEASIEAVNFFASHYKDSLDEMMISWNPVSQTARQWHKLMVEYLDGTWYKSIVILDLGPEDL